MAYTNDELKKIIHEPESHWIERKESFSAKDKICQTVCAFANDIANAGKSGVVWLGIKNDGSIVGVEANDDLLLKIDQIKSEGAIQPLPSLTIRTIHVEEKTVVAIVVSPSSLPPVRYSGRLWVRMSASTHQGNAEDERLLNERRRTKAGRSFDSEAIPTASTSDLNFRYFEDSYLPSVIAREVLQANGRTIEEKLVTSRMALGITPCLPTVAGLLTLGHSPQDWLAGAYVQFLRYVGQDHGGDVSDQAQMTGNLETVIRQTEEKIKANIQTPTNISNQDVEQRYPDYPLAALQQLLRNAILHRNYEGTNAPTRVYWFEDRIEIANPGGPFGVVNEQNFGQPHLADYRNPTIAEVLRNLNFVQKFGFGIQNARNLLRANGNPEPEFSVSAAMVIVTIRKRLQ
jgi:ATP-dependent DNA helicase RecG